MNDVTSRAGGAIRRRSLERSYGAWSYRGDLDVKDSRPARTYRLSRTVGIHRLTRHGYSFSPSCKGIVENS